MSDTLRNSSEHTMKVLKNLAPETKIADAVELINEKYEQLEDDLVDLWVFIEVTIVFF